MNRIKLFIYLIFLILLIELPSYFLWEKLLKNKNSAGIYNVKKIIQSKDINKIAASESANNSGALSSLLPLIVLGIPIVSSEVLIYYLVASKGFTFNIDSMNSFYNVLFYIPVTVIICLLLSWIGFNYLAAITSLYKKYKTWFSVGIILAITLMSLNIYPVREWLLICIIGTSTVGVFIRNWDTFPVLYGYFLTDLFWDNFKRVLIIYA